MKILFNGLCINEQPSGVQHYAEQLIFQGLKTDPDNFQAIVPNHWASLYPHSRLLTPQIDTSSRIKRISFEHTLLKTIYRTTKSDILHCPAYILPWRFKNPSVVTVHDTIALDQPKYCKNSTSLYFGTLLRHSIKHATRIITVSHTVKSDILRWTNVPAEKISVIYHGVDPIFVPMDKNQANIKCQQLGLPPRFCLFVGNIEPKKNLKNLIRGFKIFSDKTHDNCKLVIVGQTGWKCRDFMAEIERIGMSDKIFMPGYVSRSVLPVIYSLAELFVFPSLYEGFGLPPLEAMACGAPVLLSPNGALSEVYPDFCKFTNPNDPNDIAKQIEVCLNDYNWRRQSSESGVRHATNFSWERTWDQTLNVYSSIL